MPPEDGFKGELIVHASEGLDEEWSGGVDEIPRFLGCEERGAMQCGFAAEQRRGWVLAGQWQDRGEWSGEQTGDGNEESDSGREREGGMAENHWAWSNGVQTVTHSTLPVPRNKVGVKWDESFPPSCADWLPPISRDDLPFSAAVPVPSLSPDHPLPAPLVARCVFDALLPLFTLASASQLRDSH